MTSYGGFSKTSYGAQGGEDGGGFVYGGSQPGSQGAQGGQKGFADESLRPVTIKQLLDLEEAYPGADFQIDGHQITQVTIVGQVRSINPQPTNITYRLDDGTGTIDVKKWVDADKQEDADPKYELDQYVRVWGRLKSFNGKRHIGAHFIRGVDNYNEVTYHQLEATYVHLYYTKGPLDADGQNGKMNGADGNAGAGDGMFVDQYGGQNAKSEETAKLGACGPNSRKMYQFLANTPGGNEGVHLNLIASSTGLATRDILGAADELLSQGLVYTTVDDETWAILEY
ncbi:replication protein A, subunit RPA32 [Cryphonectria parasitica EP155]|uniref:Replication protein A, subunit RPA32 n=1 Tax=Cryphonectria parasitica (strain ATCC 38755 / EP155) TaxID=660469 RepID=A0A9P5CRS3_CRYP1|nr:replication protein A, subunit RPA32 [Cryphonectria parasitica EP155]KAF3767405.1 replication protein A, subunit RPA32 [Cryphonectria parasitica EP155]